MKKCFFCKFQVITFLLVVYGCNIQTEKVERRKILQAATLYSRGNLLELFNDSSYSITCFLFNSSEGKYSKIGDTIFLEVDKKAERCDLFNGKLFIKHQKDSTYWDSKAAKNVTIKVPCSKSEGIVYELDVNNKIIEHSNIYHIIN